MLRVKRFLLATVFLLLAAAVVLFVLENPQTAQLVFLGWQTPQWPLVLFISLAFTLGGLLGLLLGLPSRARAFSQMRRFRKENKALREQPRVDHG